MTNNRKFIATLSALTLIFVGAAVQVDADSEKHNLPEIINRSSLQVRDIEEVRNELFENQEVIVVLGEGNEPCGDVIGKTIIACTEQDIRDGAVQFEVPIYNYVPAH